MSKFNLKVEYVPGKDNVVADAMSRWAYPASAALHDCSWHGSAQDWAEMQAILQEKLEAGKMVGLIPSLAPGSSFLLMGELAPQATTQWCVKGCYGVTTRQGTTTGDRKGMKAAASSPANVWERLEEKHQPQLEEAGNEVSGPQWWFRKDKGA